MICPRASDLFRQVIDEASAAHDVLIQAIGLLGREHVLALQGDINGARAACDEALNCSAQLGHYYDQAYYGQLAITCLAAGDATSAWEASKAAERDSAWRAHDHGAFTSATPR